MNKQQKNIDSAKTPSTTRSSGGAGQDHLSFLEQITCHLRMLPNFVIIGAMKCGTSSLYDYLTMHPNVAPATKKEIHFFDNHFEKGLCWYRNHFSFRARQWLARMNGRRLITGEASPYYMLYPHAPKRMYDVIPNASLIVLLRNPIERSYSHYHHQVSRGREKETFEKAIRLESHRICHDIGMMEKDKFYVGLSHQRFSYLARGVYIDQLLEYEKYFPKDRILILQAEDLFQSPKEVYDKTSNFLGLEAFSPTQFHKRNTGSYHSDISIETREKLAEFYAPHNKRLFEHLGYELNW